MSGKQSFGWAVGTAAAKQVDAVIPVVIGASDELNAATGAIPIPSP